ncbi:glucose 1-dehydrogenase [Alkalibaculum sp. M08DMB]|uniref:Glucose 1-dehydrogenase n=1 Tax=Alkalibaculum sporogenes TaxID=2655001 RepID=A0A6A7KBF5_9FIRM|nr:glucose 1-dehydrogenase [Alkalibaculum sporogenes]MPW26601.1 glucose 1-dehydrogenase [Alkalibaculum sporogenes]
MINIDLSGKVAVITGSSRGIGYSCAEILAKCGARVVINYRNNALLSEELAHKIGSAATTFKGDVSIPEEVEKLMKYTNDKFGNIDILVNNAGTTTENNIEDLSIDDIEKVIRVNYFGSLYCCKYAIPYMKQNNNGSIINISSTSMYSGAGGGAHYASSKAALLGLTRNLAKDYGKYNIRTNSLAVTLVNTELLRNRTTGDLKEKIANVPLKRLCEPEEIAYMVAFLSSSLGSYISGEVITIDGGRTFA